MKIFIALTLFTTSVFGFSVIQDDTRYEITERNRKQIHLSIGHLMTRHAGCTATVVSRRHAITAAHCVMNASGVIEDAFFMPGYRKENGLFINPFGIFKSQQVRVLDEYTEIKMASYDLALITFDKDLPVTPVPMAIGATNHTNLTIAGYPDDKAPATLWEGTGVRQTDRSGKLTNLHTVDTISGQSGAAIRTNIGGKEHIIGIHAAGSNYPQYHSKAVNYGFFFTPATLNKVQAWIKEDATF